MNRKWFDKGIVAGVLFILLFCGVAFAQEKSVIKIQGIVDKVYVAKKMMRVNEELTFVWDDKTIFRNEKGSPITIDRFKRDVWVYIEGVQAQKNGPILIKKIYTIPKLIREKEKHLYPFMESFSTSIGRL